MISRPLEHFSLQERYKLDILHSDGDKRRWTSIHRHGKSRIQGVGLIFGLGSEMAKGCNRRLFHLKTPFQAIPKELAEDVQIRFS
jgi:hypothetical protein